MLSQLSITRVNATRKRLYTLSCCSTARNNSLVFLNCKKQLYDWDNDNLQDNKSLVNPDPDSHPGIPAKFPSINLESEQPCHHHVVEVIKASNKEWI
jgi:hypothetical protein